MTEKLILILTAVFSFLVFKNRVMRSSWGKRSFDTTRKILISEGISLIAFLIVSFLVESLVKLPGAVSFTVDGIFLGWALSLAGRLGEAKL